MWGCATVYETRMYRFKLDDKVEASDSEVGAIYPADIDVRAGDVGIERATTGRCNGAEPFCDDQHITVNKLFLLIPPDVSGQTHNSSMIPTL